MKELYKVTVFGGSQSHFEEEYTKEEIDTIMKFFVDMDKHNVASYDVPYITFEKDGTVVDVEDYMNF